MRAKDLFGLEQEHIVVVAASGEEFAIRTPGNAADLLGVTAYSRQQCHATMPIE
jgi:hypothetical protein